MVWSFFMFIIRQLASTVDNNTDKYILIQLIIDLSLYSSVHQLKATAINE